MIDKVTLVDHNVLSDSMSFLGPFVEEIIDHHKDEGEDRVVEDQRCAHQMGTRHVWARREVEADPS